MKLHICPLPRNIKLTKSVLSISNGSDLNAFNFRCFYAFEVLKNLSCYYLSFISLLGLDLERGVQYIFIVRAINFARLQIEAASDGFTVDFTPPETGDAIIGTGPRPAEYQSDMTKMTIRYLTVFL